MGLLFPFAISWILDFDRLGNVFDTTREEYQETMTRKESSVSVETDVDEESGAGREVFGITNGDQGDIGFSNIVDMVDDAICHDESIEVFFFHFFSLISKWSTGGEGIGGTRFLNNCELKPVLSKLWIYASSWVFLIHFPRERNESTSVVLLASFFVCD